MTLQQFKQKLNEALLCEIYSTRINDSNFEQWTINGNQYVVECFGDHGFQIYIGNPEMNINKLIKFISKGM
jgi:hypothetical protein